MGHLACIHADLTYSDQVPAVMQRSHKKLYLLSMVKLQLNLEQKSHQSPPVRYCISPGGRVVGVSVLLTAAVILFGLSKVRRGVTSTSNGRWPPE